MSKNLKHLLPFLILLALIFFAYIIDLHNELSLSRIQEEQGRLLQYVTTYPILSPIIFVAIYIVSVCLVIPDSTILSLLAGLLFPLPLAVTYIVVAETVGAVIFFLIIREVFKNVQIDWPFLIKARQKFIQHDISYLLFLRFSHVLPFWLINICAAYFNTNLKTFAWTCLVGVIPLGFILADIGHSLSKLFAENRYLTLSDIFTPGIKLALLGLGLIALSPIIVRYFYQKKIKK